MRFDPQFALIENPLHVRPPATVPTDADAYIIPHPLLTNWDEHLSHRHYLVYEGKSPKGGQLITICGLQNRAEKAAKLAAGSIDTAITQAFFAKLAPLNLGHMTQANALQVMNAAVEADIELRIGNQLAVLQRHLDKCNRKDARILAKRAAA